MSKILFETCCGSADDIINSEKGGADRAELNSALYLGGLTPSIGELDIALEQATSIKVVTMVRPRQCGFAYSEADFEVMKRDAKLLLEHGSAGIVFGFLTLDGRVDEERCKAFMDIIGEREAIFHRAIDVVPDWREALDTLICLGVKRVLTSGQKPRAIDGRETIRQMIDYAAGRIEILPGAGINESNARELLAYTGANQLHMSKRKTCLDTSTLCNPSINFGAPGSPADGAYETIDSENLKRVIDELRR